MPLEKVNCFTISLLSFAKHLSGEFSHTLLHHLHCFSSAGALNRLKRSAPTGNNINTSSLSYIEVLRGRDGRDGQGVAGPPGPRNGGVIYTRWGKTSCPNVTETELVYAGRAGGSWFRHTGGGANYLCMPSDPGYLAHQPGVQGFSPVYGAEYRPVGRGGSRGFARTPLLAPKRFYIHCYSTF